MTEPRSGGATPMKPGAATPLAGAPSRRPGTRPGPRAGAQALAWLELARVVNLPTILSNALVGWAIGRGAGLDSSFAFALSAMVLLYSAGMIFNDVCDARIDARERPERPIPSGRVSARAATIAVALLLLSALTCLAMSTSAAVGAGSVLVALIVGYDLLHAKTAASVLLMAGCRAMVYLVVACAVPVPGGWPLSLPLALTLAATLGAYIAGLSLVARLEMRVGGPVSRMRRAAPLLLAAVPLAPLILLPALTVTATSAARAASEPSAQGTRLWIVVAAAAMLLWILRGAVHVLAQPPRRRVAVAIWLSAIPLMDAFFLTLLERPELALVAALCWPITLLLQRRFAGT